MPLSSLCTSRLFAVLVAEHLRHGDALGGVVGRVQDVVGELADVLDQALALLPEQARVDDDLLRVGVRLLAHEVGLALGALDAPLGLGPGARRDLVGGLVRALEDAGGLLADLRERPLDDRLLRLAALEVGHQLAHLLHEGVDRGAVVAAHHDREAALADLVGAAAREPGGLNSLVSKSAMGAISLLADLHHL